MDQLKTGRFIANLRKQKGLTQVQLAQKLNITDRAVSKWENGKALPDVAIMPELCKLLDITVNELLSGGKIDSADTDKNTQMLLLEMTAQKQAADKRLLRSEIIMIALSVTILLGCTVIAAYADIKDIFRILIIAGGFAAVLITAVFSLKTEQTAGYYECGKCGHRYVPTYKAVFSAMHMGWTRYMRCPECGKKSWQKKVLSK